MSLVFCSRVFVCAFYETLPQIERTTTECFQLDKNTTNSKNSCVFSDCSFYSILVSYFGCNAFVNLSQFSKSIFKMYVVSFIISFLKSQCFSSCWSFCSCYSISSKAWRSLVIRSHWRKEPGKLVVSPVGMSVAVPTTGLLASGKAVWVQHSVWSACPWGCQLGVPNRSLKFTQSPCSIFGCTVSLLREKPLQFLFAMS